MVQNTVLLTPNSVTSNTGLTVTLFTLCRDIAKKV